MAVLLQGILHAAAVVGVQLALAQWLADVPAGARAHGVGATLAILLMALAGLALGARRRGRQIGAAGAASAGGESMAGAISDEGSAFAFDLSKTTTWHWDAVVTAGVLSLVGLVAYFGGVVDGLLPATGGVGRAMFATDAVVFVGLVFVNIGYALGFNAPKGAFRSSLIGFAVFVAVAAVLGYAARFVSYEATTVAGTAAAGFGVAALVTGFQVAWSRRRLSFVELVLIAGMVSFSLYLTAALGPSEWTRASNLPEEQILLALALFPPIGIIALLNVGGSLGFLLNGGGRFDPGFRVELRVAMRYLSAQSVSIIIGLVVLALNLFAAAGVGGLFWSKQIVSGCCSPPRASGSTSSCCSRCAGSGASWWSAWSP